MPTPQPQFMTHAQVAPPVAVSKGSGLFNALIIVLVVLAAAGTGGLLFMERTLMSNVENAEAELGTLKEKLNIPAINEAKSLQQQIEYGQQALAGHIYASPSINFIEQNLLDTTRITTFLYNDKRISMSASSPGYLTFAEQIKHLRSSKIVESFTFGTPALMADGSLAYSLDITLADSYVHMKPQ